MIEIGKPTANIKIKTPIIACEMLNGILGVLLNGTTIRVITIQIKNP